MGAFITESSAVGPPAGAKGEAPVVRGKQMEVHLAFVLTGQEQAAAAWSWRN